MKLEFCWIQRGVWSDVVLRYSRRELQNFINTRQSNDHDGRTTRTQTQEEGGGDERWMATKVGRHRIAEE